MSASQKGFTLIELIVVILILGILSAVALPRFMAAQVDARIAKAQGIYGAVRAASALTKARCELDLGRNLAGAGECGNATQQVKMDGQIVDMINHYPAATDAGIRVASDIQLSDIVPLAAGATYNFQIPGATTLATCTVSYTESPAIGVAPVITVTTSGC